MKKLYFTLFALFAIGQSLLAVSYQIKTSSSLVYTPDSLTVHVGDTVIISASTFHPLVQVDFTSWEAKIATPLPGGWGTKTSAYTFVATIPETIYFVCSSHVSLGMRGKIIVQNASGVNEQIADANNINFSPNPVTSTAVIGLKIPIGENIQIKVYDYFGNLIKNIPAYNDAVHANNSFIFDAGDLINGIYILMVSDGTNIYAKKIIVLK